MRAQWFAAAHTADRPSLGMVAGPRTALLPTTAKSVAAAKDIVAHDSASSLLQEYVTDVVSAAKVAAKLLQVSLWNWSCHIKISIGSAANLGCPGRGRGVGGCKETRLSWLPSLRSIPLAKPRSVSSVMTVMPAYLLTEAA